MKDQKPEVRNKIIESRELSDETETQLRAALEDFKKQFSAKK